MTGLISIANEERRSRLGPECISDVLKRGRLKWGHVEKMQKDNWVNRVRSMNVDSKAIKPAKKDETRS